MRLWSIHPTHLDTKGLVAVWREGLLALHVLRGQTKGYLHHPQLFRFKNHALPIEAITAYLHAIVDEAGTRSFSFNRDKLETLVLIEPMLVTTGQLSYETAHLKEKLKLRDTQRYTEYEAVTELTAHPIFKVVPGDVEVWEKRK